MSYVFIVKEVNYCLKMSSNLYRGYDLCISVLPDLFELSSEDLQVVEGPSHGKHHLSVVAGGYTDVPALWLLPLAH